MIVFWFLAGLATLLGGMHLVARYQCRRMGHCWKAEYTLRGTEQTALRCQRCRQWVDET